VATLYIDDVRPCVVPSSTLISLYSPMDVAYDAGTDRLFIANRDGPAGGSLNVAVISPTPQITRTVTGVLSAQGVAQDVARHRLYVAGWDWLNVLNSDTYSRVVTITLRFDPKVEVKAHTVAYNPNNSKIYVTGFGDNSITVLDANTPGIPSIIARWTDSPDHPLLEPSYIAVEPNSGKVYVTNHAHGRPSGWVTVIDGFTNEIVKTIYPDPGGELYGAAVDPVHGQVYVAAINAANIYVIDAATDMQLGSFQVRRWSDNQPVPLRMIAVNPNPGLGTKIRVWLTSSSTELNGLDNVISLTGNWPNLEPPALGADLPHSPERGIRFDPVNKYLFIASAASNRVTILRDTPETQQCLWPFVEPHGPTRAAGLYVVVNQGQ
jgi:DNA-binding beta-propeller fold protein YncE